MVRVEIDLNSRDRKGHVRARVERADGPLSAGDAVVVFESEDGVAADARVVSVEDGIVALDVDWNSMRDDELGRTFEEWSDESLSIAREAWPAQAEAAERP